MKKGLVLLCLILVAGSLVALDISAGASFVVGPAWQTLSASNSYYDEEMKRSFNLLGLGGKVFGDFTYGQVGVGYLVTSYNGGKYEYTVSGVSLDMDLDDTDAAWHYITLEALGKYPFDLGGVVLAPVGGLAYDICINFYDDDGEKVDPDTITNNDGDTVGYSYFNNLRLLLGGAVDVPFDKLYLRSQLLFSMVLSQPYMSDWVSYMKDDGGATSASSSLTALEFSVGIGYKF
ncbi:hypothetical protein [Spirochaeta thermophila]|uniref:Outer membrane protein beta-barrel domain-containing protein n=1 Tax=Winmispira thermophila (strain ATCC 49972 / DSM 6192 / RI 19.B1) TaxID=665571 RepID=E0RQ05_WINT6|nr:hypothetical protein [Spirochaeta thermophila]ADN02858.1 hypothetical protein STHERM_c19230 [Spirochaeta thermophila DSM 6192]